MSSASRSRMALAYSERLRRCSGERPGFGVVAAARSIEVSRNETRPSMAGCWGGGAARGGFWSRRAERRHHAAAELPDDFFEGLCARRHILEADLLKAEPAGFGAVVMAGDAVFGDQGLVGFERCDLIRRACNRRPIARSPIL